MKKIIDLTTGDEIITDLTKDEIVEKTQAQKDLAERLEVIAEKDAKKAALLEKLGITEDEARLLLG